MNPKRFSSASVQNKNLRLNSLVWAVTDVNIKVVPTVGVNAHTTFGSGSLIGKAHRIENITSTEIPQKKLTIWLLR